IAKYRARDVAAEPAPELLSGGTEPAPAEAPVPADAADAAARVRRQALASLRSGIARAVAAKVAGAGGDGSPPEAHPIYTQVESALDDSTLEGLVGQLHTASPELAAGEDHVLSGEVHVVPLAQVLQLLQDQSQTGILTITRGTAKVDVYFRQGKVEFAFAAGVSEEFLLGRFIIDNNLMARQDLDTLLKSRTGSTQLLGAQLVKLGYVTPGELRQVMGQQTSELIYELLRWSAGRFVFRATKELPAVALDAALGLSIEGILMEGFRRVDEWHLIEKEVDNFDVVFVRNEDAVAHMGKGRLTREEQTILDLVNGKNTVKEIIRQSRMSSFDVSKMLYRLLSIKLLRKRVAPVAV
ncbi:MAG: DUF4388 domain-containing protein, partial [Deltaproteobacteria bacterium]|nr:DUF4388 domain-containing protein [Deltaproteobacteria bacterium]